MKKSSKKKSTQAHKPVRAADVPATKRMLDKLEQKLTHELSAFQFQVDARFDQVDAQFNKVDARFNKVDARFNKMEARFNEVDARFDQVDARFSQVEAKINQVESKIETVLAAVQRVGLMVEEQNARNKFVLDGYANLNDRIEKLEHIDDKNTF